MQLGIDNARGLGPRRQKQAFSMAYFGVLLAWFAAAALASDSVQARTLDAGFEHSCAVTDRGGVKCWGDNSYYGLGDGTDTSSVAPVEVLGLGSVVTDVATGNYYSCALTTTGAVKCWGYNGQGQVGGGSGEFAVPQPVGVVGLGSGVRAIATGPQHACALTATGGVRCWGANVSGALGNGTETDSATPVDVVGLSSGAMAIHVGNNYSCALTAAGGAKCWGDNVIGQLGDGTNVNRSVPVDVVGLSSGVTAIAAGAWHTCAIVDAGRVKCWGANGSGAFGNGTTSDSLTPVESTSLDVPATAVTVGYWHTCALTEASAVKCWGYNSSGQLGDGTTTNRTIAGDVAGLETGVAAIASGASHTCARLRSGDLKCWGNGSAGQLGNGVPVQRRTAVDVAGLSLGAAAITTAEHHSCALTTTGDVACWGANHGGELGDGTMIPHATPAVVALDVGIRSVATGSAHSCAVTLGNGALCWGSNFSGQIGDGYFTNRSRPVPVWNLGANVAMLALGGVHSCALTVDGGVRCWGDNMIGQLGDGTTNSRPVPIQVTGLDSGVVTIAAGWFHSCAVTTAGGVKCWGQNGRGELGDGTATNRATPVDVAGLSAGVIAIDAAEQRTCALTQAGIVKCWGDGQLTPASVGGLPLGVTAIAVGAGHACALTATSGLKCWGSNYHGQLGDGTRTNRPEPVDVVGLTSGVASVVAGRTSTCAVTAAGAAKCWGSNADGQLGNGEAGYALTPQTVVGTPFGLVFRNGFD